MSAPPDFTILLSNHGPNWLLEVRDGGRLTMRRWLTADELVCENQLANIVGDHHNRQIDARSRGRQEVSHHAAY